MTRLSRQGPASAGQSVAPGDPASCLPEATARLFPDLDSDRPLDPSSSELVICRLLEEGERDDLRWLVESLGEAAIAASFKRRAGRQLSRRSGRFWSLVLGLAKPEVAAAREALWPL